MAKRSQARRKTFQRQNYEETTFRDRKTRSGRRQDQDNANANVVDLNARTHLHTAYICGYGIASRTSCHIPPSLSAESLDEAPIATISFFDWMFRGFVRRVKE
jgi:hypothetical protein